MASESKEELIRLVELDYQRTAQYIDRVVGVGTLIRGWAITLWAGLVGLGVSNHDPLFAILAVPVIFVFWVVDSYHAWLYDCAMTHAKSLERVSRLYYAYLSRGDDDPDLEQDMLVALRSHGFGLFSSMGSFSDSTDLLFTRPKILFRALYPGLAIVAVVAAAAIAFGWFGNSTNSVRSPHPSPTHVSTPR